MNLLYNVTRLQAELKALKEEGLRLTKQLEILTERLKLSTFEEIFETDWSPIDFILRNSKLTRLQLVNVIHNLTTQNASVSAIMLVISMDILQCFWNKGCIWTQSTFKTHNTRDGILYFTELYRRIYRRS